MGIISILFLVFGWIFSIKGLIIVSLVISALFATILTLCIFTSNSKTNEKYHEGIIENIMQFTVLILSIVKLVKGF
jgi:hypothetical protein